MLAAALIADALRPAVRPARKHRDVQVDDLGSFAVGLSHPRPAADVHPVRAVAGDESLESVFSYLVAR